MSEKLPVIIIGAGVAGLCLAQALKQARIPFEIYERDPAVHRSAGWALTIHWALPALKACLPSALFDRLNTIQVDPQQGGENDKGRFLFLDLSTAEPRYVIPPSPRLRINRRKFRDLLVEELDVTWGKSISSFEVTSDGVSVAFTDGTVSNGCLLVGADGSGSKTRKLLVGDETATMHQLPIRFMGTTVRLNQDQVEPLLQIDPLLFQGCHPDTGTFMWFSVLSTPAVNGSVGGEEYYEAQLNLSWNAKSPSDEAPASNIERLAKMKEMAKPLEARFRRVVEELQDDSDIMEIKLRDWPPVDWNNCGGRVTLVGDAAHAMTMYRGQGANHAIEDAAKLAEQLGAVKRGSSSLMSGVEPYEAEMRPRGYEAVLLSRQACLDAHDLANLTAESPLVSKRARISPPQEDGKSS